jgi:hypothetical protein
MVANRAQSTTTQQLKANVSNQHQRSPSLKGKHSHSLKAKSWSLLQVSYELNSKKKGGRIQHAHSQFLFTKTVVIPASEFKI